MTPLQRRTLAYLSTVDSAGPEEIREAERFWNRVTVSATRQLMARLITAGHARNISTTRRCVYRITLQGRQAIAPPLVCVAWKDSQSAPLKPATAEALRVRLDGEMGMGTHRIVPA